ncbi:MAG TPA: universal stress protein [Nitrososphaeraceae archaeon]|nr:universal stress protein [Nitrososphaeraceae archaeon]
MSEPNFLNIVVAIDGSEPSFDAANYAISIAELYNSQLTAVYAVSARVRDDVDSDMPEEKMPDQIRKIMNEAKIESEPWFKRIRSAIESESLINFRTKIILSSVKVSGVIVNYSEDAKVDLIVVGTRGRSGFKRLLLGSVASDTVMYAHCPVLVVK